MRDDPYALLLRDLDAGYPAWEELPFWKKLAEGSLERKTFQAFLAQDLLYLRQFSRAVRIAVSAAPEEFGKTLALFADTSLEQETIHRSLTLPLRSPSSPTRDAGKSLCESAREFPEGLAAFLPCFSFLPRWAAGRTPDAEHPYGDWIRSYAARDFQALCADFRDLILSGPRPRPERAREVLFQAIRREIDFFDQFSTES